MSTSGTIYGSESKRHSPIRVVFSRIPLLNYDSGQLLGELPPEEVPLSCWLMTADLWINSWAINIWCIQFGPDRSDAKTLIDVEVEPLDI